MRVEIHRSARRHGVKDVDLRHAISQALVIIDLDPNADPPKVLCIGPDRAANLLDVVWLELEGGTVLTIHAMALRATFYDLLPNAEETQ